jgi:ribosome maturation factor RimP
MWKKIKMKSLMKKKIWKLGFGVYGINYEEHRKGWQLRMIMLKEGKEKISEITLFF